MTSTHIPSRSNGLITAFFDRTNNTQAVQPFLKQENKAAALVRRHGSTDENAKPAKRPRLNKTAPPRVVGHARPAPLQEPPARRRRWAILRTYDFLQGHASGEFLCTATTASTPILDSFVSSHRTDVYTCHATNPAAFLSPPYSCAFSHDAKKGRRETLAIASEQGTVELTNTCKRSPWDPEPPRTVIAAHSNAILDIAWSGDDTQIATASGDHSAKIFCTQSQVLLHTLQGHTSTLKCVRWNPNHRDLLATAGRDGSILLWDLRRPTKEARLQPVLAVEGAHDPRDCRTAARSTRRLSARSVTSFVYIPSSPQHLISSGSNDGILRKWDVRLLSAKNPNKHNKAILLEEYPCDPTIQGPSHRSRGISSLILGSGPTESMLFGLGADSRIYTYNSAGIQGVPLSFKQSHDKCNTYGHERMTTNSFYIRLALSPCGRWLASGSSNGSAFLFDVGVHSAFNFDTKAARGVQLNGQKGEVGALDWAYEQLATCSDDETVRVWRPNPEVSQQCRANREDAKWDWAWSTKD